MKSVLKKAPKTAKRNSPIPVIGSGFSQTNICTGFQTNSDVQLLILLNVCERLKNQSRA